ncbi:hypothetical protein [Mechercharimyces sp. CAU 1602]|uniref:hypothetical protein n=1 Tax=Mechercharimyces sp. CAU 1602 TaxID=2973933 RepID=UPI002163FE8F|nr:hypothetical protein [Mechercharimyces sp. CAU 1602]MCS1350894.1 hypothetical protein [Mechercharimyces sp. CAU 1602]
MVLKGAKTKVAGAGSDTVRALPEFQTIPERSSKKYDAHAHEFSLSSNSNKKNGEM